MPLVLNPLVKTKSNVMTSEAPPIAAAGNKNGPAKYSGTKWLLNTIIEVAPKAAPAETPINPGSANGFRNKPWSDAPDNANEAPTKPAKTTRGVLIWVRTVFWMGSKVLVKISTIGTE